METDAEVALQNLFIRDEIIARTVGGRRRRMHKTIRRGGAVDGSIVTAMMTIRDQIKLYHWQTRMFSRHKATDDLVASLDTNIDTFVETYMGKYGRVGFSGDSGAIELKNSSALDLNQFISSSINWLVGLTEQFDATMDTDLLNIRDEMVAEFNKLKYLLTLD
jgi:hypothetical protein